MIYDKPRQVFIIADGDGFVHIYNSIIVSVNVIFDVEST
jgi:hypothetical protein